MERMKRLTNEMDWINRLACELNPLERMAREVNPLEHAAHTLNPMTYFTEKPPLSCYLDKMYAMTSAARNPFSRHCEQMEALARIAKPTSPDLMQLLGDAPFPVERFDLSEIPFPEFPESRTLAELQEMDDDELGEFLGGNVSVTTAMLGIRELTRRQLNEVTRPHWSVIWTFWLVLISAIIGAIGVYLMLRQRS
jgi:hypothetical protein